MLSISVIKLNVGGKKFFAKRETLCDSTYFKNLLGQADKNTSFSEKDKDEIFIDRDGNMFRHVLQYLRTKTVYAYDMNTLTKLKVEAEYFGLDNFMNDIEKKESQIEDNMDEYSFIDTNTLLNLYAETLNSDQKEIQIVETFNTVGNEKICLVDSTHVTNNSSCTHGNKKDFLTTMKKTIIRKYVGTNDMAINPN